MKTLRTDEILEIEKIFLENGDVEDFQDRFPLEMCDVIVHYEKHEDGTEEMGIYLIDDVYPSVVNGVFLDSVYESSENYYTDNTEGEWKEIVDQYFDCELEGGEKYFSEHEGIWEKFQEAKDKREFIRNLFKEA
jgi:hypothetical protein